MQDIRIAAAQFEARDRDKDYNFSQIEALAHRAVDDGAQIVSFHECCICGYSFLQELSREEIAELAEPVPDGPSTRRLEELSKKLKVPLLAGLVESDGDKLYNTYLHCTKVEYGISNNLSRPMIGNKPASLNFVN